MPPDDPKYTSYYVMFLLMNGQTCTGDGGVPVRHTAHPAQGRQEAGWYTRGSRWPSSPRSYVRELARREPGITSIAVHPGEIDSNIWDNADVIRETAATMLAPDDGAKTQIYAALAPGLPSGVYIDDFDVETWASPVSRDMELAQRLWDWTVVALRDSPVAAAASRL